MMDALASMRQAFDRPNGVRGASGTPATSATTARPVATQSMHRHRGTISTEDAAPDAIVISSDDDSMVDEPGAEDMAQSSLAAPSQHRPVQTTQRQPGYGLARLDGSFLPGKRAATADRDGFPPKRQRTSQGDDGDDTAIRTAASFIGAVQGLLSGADQPVVSVRDASSPDAQTHTPDLVGSPLSSERRDSVPAAKGSRQVSNETQLPTPVQSRNSNQTGHAEGSMMPPSLRQDTGANADRGVVDDGTVSQLETKPRDKTPEPRHPKGFSKDLDERPYDIVKGKGGQFESRGFLLPGKYSEVMTMGNRESWVCPIRSCRYAFMKTSTLEKHWIECHRRCLLNDNNDGTFSVKGKYKPREPRSANAIVISRDPLDPSEPPMVATRSHLQETLEMRRAYRELGECLLALTAYIRRHYLTMPDDNRDGTSSELGRHTNRGEGSETRPPVAKSKNPPPTDARLAEPNIPPNDAHRGKLSDASLARLKTTTHDKAQKVNEQTVDQTMTDGILGQRVAATEDSGSSEESDAMSASGYQSSPAESDDLEGEGPEKVESPDAADEKDQDEPPGALDLETPTARENWRTVRGFFTVKDFPPPRSATLRALLSRPRAREIVLRLASLKFCVAWPKDVAMLIMQLVGRESPRPCGRCEKGVGTFAGCVMLTPEVADELQRGACSCVNCAWKSQNVRTCNLEQLLREEEEARGGPAGAEAPKARPPVVEPAGAHEVDRGDQHSDDDSDNLHRLRARRSDRLLSNDGSGRNPPARQPPSEDDGDNRGGDGGETAARTAGTRVTTASQQQQQQPPPPRAEWADGRFTFGVEVVSPGAALRLDADGSALRMCTLASGWKVSVRVKGEPAFMVGLGGMFRLAPGASAEVVNDASGAADAVLHVSSVGTGTR